MNTHLGLSTPSLCICDDEAAVTGTINFDYRSLYLHFENACLFIYNAVVLQAKMTFCVRRKNPRRSSLKIWGISKSIEVCSAVSITQSCGYLHRFCKKKSLATVYKGNIIKNLIMDCQSYTKYRPNETTGGIFVSWRRKEELPTGA